MIAPVEQHTGAENIAWDLSDLYTGRDDPRLAADLTETLAQAAAFAADYRGQVGLLRPAEMAALLRRYEDILERFGRAGSYAQMIWTVDTDDPANGALVQRVDEQGAQLQQQLVFLELEWADVPETAAQALIDAPELAAWRHWLEVARLQKPHLLSEPEEKIMAEKAVTGASAWGRFFGEMHGAARYTFKGEPAQLEVVLKELYNPERAERLAAAEAVTAGLQSQARVNTYIFNTLLADKAANDRLRSYPSWLSSRNLANEVADASVQALIDAVTGRYDIVARYYTLKKKLLGLDELFDYDRYAPLPAADAFYTWEQARQIVLDAYSAFDARLGQIAAEFFDKRWIDAPVRPNKRGGAYATSTVPSAHPYIFLNYLGKARDVETLAHELGHGVHMYLSRPRGVLSAGTPLTTAETASVFGEMLVFQSLLAQQADPGARLAMLTGKIEGSFATVFRQTAMNRFEDAIHTARRSQGELTTDQFNEAWLQTQRAMFQGSVTLREDYGLWWSYIPHFINVPGYVYAYAFGELLVLALYARYEQAPDGFAGAYLEMLGMGGSDWPHEIVRPLGIDLTDPAFWDRGLAILDDLVAQAEALAQTS